MADPHAHHKEPEESVLLDDYLTDHLDERAYDQPNFLFWVRTVCEAMSFLGPETDADLKDMLRQLQDHLAGAEVAAAVIDEMRRRIVRSMTINECEPASPLGLKYRRLNAIADSRERNLADLYDWQYGVVTAWQIINLRDDNDQALIQFIQQRAKEQNVELYEKNNGVAASD